MINPGNGSADSSYAENAEFWMKIIHKNLDRYRSELTDKAVLAAIGAKDGSVILDAGCGEGYLSRVLARQGAQTIGVDTCGKLIESARSTAREHGLDIDYLTRSADDLPIVGGYCDTVVCNHLINDLENLTQPFREFHRVIKKGGRLVILMLHPCFYRGRADHLSRNSYPTPGAYFSVRTVEQEFKVAGIRSPALVKIWLRPLEDYISELCSTGFHIVSLSEPHPSDEQLTADTWWRENFVRPLFMLIVAEK